jgi:hypothetical protein
MRATRWPFNPLVESEFGFGGPIPCSATMSLARRCSGGLLSRGRLALENSRLDVDAKREQDLWHNEHVKNPQSIDSQALSRIYGHGRGWVFTPASFLDLGSRAAVASALARHKPPSLSTTRTTWAETSPEARPPSLSSSSGRPSGSCPTRPPTRGSSSARPPPRPGPGSTGCAGIWRPGSR